MIPKYKSSYNILLRLGSDLRDIFLLVPNLIFKTTMISPYTITTL